VNVYSFLVNRKILALKSQYCWWVDAVSKSNYFINPNNFKFNQLWLYFERKGTKYECPCEN